MSCLGVLIAPELTLLVNHVFKAGWPVDWKDAEISYRQNSRGPKNRPSGFFYSDLEWFFLWPNKTVRGPQWFFLFRPGVVFFCDILLYYGRVLW